MVVLSCGIDVGGPSASMHSLGTATGQLARADNAESLERNGTAPADRAIYLAAGP